MPENNKNPSKPSTEYILLDKVDLDNGEYGGGFVESILIQTNDNSWVGTEFYMERYQEYKLFQINSGIRKYIETHESIETAAERMYLLALDEIKGRLNGQAGEGRVWYSKDKFWIGREPVPITDFMKHARGLGIKTGILEKALATNS